MSSSPPSKVLFFSRARVASPLRSASDVWLAVRMLLWSAALPLLKRVVPLARLARVMSVEHALDVDPRATERIVLIAEAIYRGRVSLRDNCLERSLILYRFLSRSGADPRLIVGVRKGVADVTGHVWVVVEDRPLDGDPAALGAFTELVVFGAGGRIEQRRAPTPG